jgi:hypothetical protein
MVATTTLAGGQALYAVAVGPIPDTLTFLDGAGRTVGTAALDIEPRF